MMSNFIKFGTLKLAFALLVVCLIISQATNQTLEKGKISYIYNTTYGDFSKEMKPTKYFEFELMSVKFFGKNPKNETVEIRDYSYNISNVY